MKFLNTYDIFNEKLDENPKWSLETIEELLSFARIGDKIVLNGRAIWGVLGDRTSLYDYANQLLSEKWEKGKDRLKKKLLSVNPYEDTIEVYSYYNIARFRGHWKKIRTYHLNKK
jgi:hypothetical protein